MFFEKITSVCVYAHIQAQTHTHTEGASLNDCHNFSDTFSNLRKKCFKNL